MKRMALVVAATIALGMAIGIGPAAAKQDRTTPAAANQDRILATPAAACRALVANHAGGYTSFGNCVGHLKKDVAADRFPADDGSGLISLSQRCTEFEQGMTDPETGEVFKLTYPFFFSEGGPEAGWPFPEFTAQNHQQCEVTLFTYHTLAGA